MENLTVKNEGQIQDNILLPLETPWKISNPGPISLTKPQGYPVKLVDNRTDKTERKLDALYVCSKDDKGHVKTKDDSLIIHCHGGGFVFMSPKQYAKSLCEWSEKLDVPVLCPNYRKAPENKFPDGLQDCLDTFLFVTSGRPEVKELLGFVPKKILLTGDSAGGNLAVSVTIALNEIRRNNSNHGTKMPTALCVQYPFSDPTFIMNPSSALIAMSPLTCGHSIFSMIAAYPPTGILMPRVGFENDSQELQTWAELYAPAWKEPLINNLAYKDRMKELSDVPLYVNVCEFDPLLDEGLLLAKYWPNAVTQVVADIHGWCSFASEVSHKKDMDEMYDMMAKGLQINIEE